jgi:hypothetical protein
MAIVAIAAEPRELLAGFLYCGLVPQFLEFHLIPAGRRWGHGRVLIKLPAVENHLPTVLRIKAVSPVDADRTKTAIYRHHLV